MFSKGKIIGSILCKGNKMPFRKSLSDGASVVAKERNMISLNDLPRAHGVPFLGTIPARILAGGGLRLHEYADRRHKQLGPIYVENMNSTDLVFISDPELMRTVFMKLEGKYPMHALPEIWLLYNKKYGCDRGLLFMDGEEWLHHRKMANKHLMRTNIDWMLCPIGDTIDGFVNRLTDRCGAHGGHFIPDLETETFKLSVDVIISILSGSGNMAKKSHNFATLLDNFSSSVQKIFQYSAKMSVLPAIVYASLQFPAWIGFKNSADTTIKLAHKLVEEILNNTVGESEGGLVNKFAQEGISKRDLLRLVSDLIIAAGDTTSLTLLWTLYLLAKNQTVYKELQNKISNGDNVEELVISILKEAMRLFPVAPFLTRILTEDCVLDNIALPSNTPIIYSMYTACRDKGNFTNPEEFNPSRWLQSEQSKAQTPTHLPYASMPFALGARSCIGKRIAMEQLSSTIKMIAKTFDMELLNTNKVDMLTMMVSVPKDKIYIKFTLK